MEIIKKKKLFYVLNFLKIKCPQDERRPVPKAETRCHKTV